MQIRVVLCLLLTFLITTAVAQTDTSRAGLIQQLDKILKQANNVKYDFPDENIVKKQSYEKGTLEVLTTSYDGVFYKTHTYKITYKDIDWSSLIGYDVMLTYETRDLYRHDTIDAKVLRNYRNSHLSGLVEISLNFKNELKAWYYAEGQYPRDGKTEDKTTVVRFYCTLQQAYEVLWIAFKLRKAV